ncbi:MAG: hypothetical protein MUP76_09785 [Acidimicrobiia bacterium]|nr:hypothetical protein [Acidimicrobiia bacterium]
MERHLMFWPIVVMVACFALAGVLAWRQRNFRDHCTHCGKPFGIKDNRWHVENYSPTGDPLYRAVYHDRCWLEHFQ